MIRTVSRDGALELMVRGRVDRHDLTAVRRDVDEHVRLFGSAPMMIWFDDFEGYASPQAFLDDLRLTVEHWSHIPRLALVGAPDWVKALARIQEAIDSKTEVACFDVAERAAARRWTTRPAPPALDLPPAAHT